MFLKFNENRISRSKSKFDYKVLPNKKNKKKTDKLTEEPS